MVTVKKHSIPLVIAIGIDLWLGVTLILYSDLYEPHREKTCLLGFRPGLTQTGLYSHKLEISDF